jgi:hypothetical protein
MEAAFNRLIEVRNDKCKSHHLYQLQLKNFIEIKLEVHIQQLEEDQTILKK